MEYHVSWSAHQAMGFREPDRLSYHAEIHEDRVLEFSMMYFSHTVIVGVRTCARVIISKTKVDWLMQGNIIVHLNLFWEEMWNPGYHSKYCRNDMCFAQAHVREPMPKATWEPTHAHTHAHKETPWTTCDGPAGIVVEQTCMRWVCLPMGSQEALHKHSCEYAKGTRGRCDPVARDALCAKHVHTMFMMPLDALCAKHVHTMPMCAKHVHLVC